MHSVDLLEEALTAARQLGYVVREEWFDGRGGGVCQLKGRTWLLLDMSLSPREQLDVVCGALRSDPATTRLALSPALAGVLSTRRSA